MSVCVCGTGGVCEMAHPKPCEHTRLLATAETVRHSEVPERQEVRVQVRCWDCHEKMVFSHAVGVGSTLAVGTGVYRSYDSTELRASFRPLDDRM